MTKTPRPTQPHSLDAEAAVLGALLLDTDAIHSVTSLRPNHFYDPVYEMIFSAACELSEDSKSIDFVTLSDKLKDNNKIEELGGTAFLASLTERVPTSSVIEHYASIVTDNAIKRSYIKASQTIIESAYDNALSASDIQASAEHELFAIGQQRTLGGFMPIAERTSEWFDQMAEVHSLPEDQRKLRRVLTGIPSLDQKITLRPGNFVVVAGRPSMGKSAFALNLALNACDQKKTVGFFSYEMTPDEIMDRVVASRLGVDSRQFEEGSLDDALYSNIGPILDRINQYEFYLEHPHDRLLSTLVSRARRLKKLHGLDLLVVDYLQLIFTTEKFAQQSRLQMISHVSNTLKYLAIELDVPIIALSQLSRNTENRPDKRPQLSDLRESGEIEQDAHIVMMLYREEYYEPDTDRMNLTDVFIRKNRNGDTGSCELYFNREHQLFTSVLNTSSPQPLAIAA